MHGVSVKCVHCGVCVEWCVSVRCVHSGVCGEWCVCEVCALWSVLVVHNVFLCEVCAL